MNEIAEKDVINIENMIYEIRGVQVMLDSDCGMKTPRLSGGSVKL